LVADTANVRPDCDTQRDEAGRQFEKSMTTIKQLVKTFAPELAFFAFCAGVMVLAWIAL